MGLKDIIIDSFRYATSNWVKVIILGLVIFIADMVNEFSSFQTAAEIYLILLIIGIFLAIFELGYIFRIIEETTYGSETLPQFNRIWETFFHGIIEILFVVLYFVVPFILVVVGIFKIYDLIGSISQEFDLFVIITVLFLASLFYLPFQAAILNMANHHGTVRSGFDLKRILLKMRKMGLKNLGFIYILSVIFTGVVEYSLSDAMVILPYGLGDIISGLLIAPFILIFTARVLGLINKTLNDKY